MPSSRLSATTGKRRSPQRFHSARITAIAGRAHTYDTLGRLVQTTERFEQEAFKQYVSTTGFDDLGRVSSTTYPSGLALGYAYSNGTAPQGKTAGFLISLANAASPALPYWSISALASPFDARGNLLKAVLGNGISSDNVFDTISSKAFALRAGAGSGADRFDQRYTYDAAHNLVVRTNGFGGGEERFAYDKLDRLRSYTVNSVERSALTYNAIGNILTKSDVGGYHYSASRPHAVSWAAGTAYGYDANGNLLSASGNQSRSNTWSDYNLPETISANGAVTRFEYDEQYKRVKETTTAGSTERRLWLLHPDNAGGLAFEREETWVSGVMQKNENRHYIAVGGQVIGVVKTHNANDPEAALNGTASSDANFTLYWHKDALGSIVAVSNGAGTVIERPAFDAWGRRLLNDRQIDWSAAGPAHGDRGYTGHEHLDEQGLVHMNARLYDPVLARFLSPDPLIQSPHDLQNYNQYSYVLNSPLRYTDPSGKCIWDFCIVEIFVAVAGAAAINNGNQYWRIAGTVALAWALGPGFGEGGGLVETGLGTTWAGGTSATAVGNSAIAGGLTSYVASGGDVEAAFIGAIAGGAFTYVGGPAGLGGAEKIIAHAVIGCAQGAVTGGSCGPSAMAAAFGKLATPSGIPAGVEPFVASVIAGGTASVIGGGKFANGALQAAMGYLFNQLSGGPRYLNKPTSSTDVLIHKPDGTAFWVPLAAASAAATAVNLGHENISVTHPTVEQVGQRISLGGLALTAGGLQTGYVPAMAAGSGLQVTGAALEFFGRPNSSNALSLATELATDRIPAVRFGAGVSLGVSAIRFGASTLPVSRPPQLSELNVP